MSDYIKREDVYAALNRAKVPFDADGMMYGLTRIPAADVVERKRGEWVGYPDSFKYEHVYDRDAIVCPFCEESWNIVDNDTERFNFCPNCGADMRALNAMCREKRIEIDYSEQRRRVMTKHDRLMKALAEIKDICAKNDDEEFGCGNRCPFLMAEDGNGFRGCEIMNFTRQNTVDIIDTPSEWAEEGE